MSIRATYTDSSKTVENAILKVSRIWGSKTEGWHSWINVFEKEDDVSPLTTFIVKAEFIEDVNPYISLYNEVAKLSFISNIKHDVPHGYVAPAENEKNEKTAKRRTTRKSQ